MIKIVVKVGALVGLLFSSATTYAASPFRFQNAFCHANEGFRVVNVQMTSPRSCMGRVCGAKDASLVGDDLTLGRTEGTFGGIRRHIDFFPDPGVVWSSRSNDFWLYVQKKQIVTLLAGADLEIIEYEAHLSFTLPNGTKGVALPLLCQFY